MKTTRTLTMKAIAATLAALSMMSTISMAVKADELTDDISQITTIEAVEEQSEPTAEDQTNTAADEQPGTAADEQTYTADMQDTGCEDTYTITFVTDGGTEIAPITAEAGAAIQAPADPTRDGLYFLGWDTPIPEIMPAENITITAEWSTTPIYESAEEGFADTANINEVDENGQTISDDDLIFTASADEICLMQNSTEYNTETAEDYAKAIGIELGDAALETIADAIPGGKMIVAPFKVMFHSAADGEDPMAIMDRKLDQIDGKLDDMEQHLKELDDHIAQNTKLLERKIDNTQSTGKIKGYFEELSPAVLQISTKIKSYENNPRLNKQQKIMNIANLAQNRNYDTMFNNVMNIKSSMNGGGNVYSDFFDTLYDNKAFDRMISKEAYLDAKEVADDLATQYISACLLIAEVQIAAQAVGEFTEDDITALGQNTKEQEYYKYCDPFEQLSFTASTKLAIEACANGYQRFEAKYNNPDFINKGSCRKHFDMNCVQYSVGKSSNESKTDFGEMGDFIRNRNRNITQEELTALVDYIRTTYPGTSFIEFLRNMGVKEYYKWNSSAYLVLDDTVAEGITLTKTYQASGWERLWDSHIYKYFDHRFGFTKAIDVTDPNCEVRSLTIKTCKQKKELNTYGWEMKHQYYDFAAVSNNYLVIYS